MVYYIIMRLLVLYCLIITAVTQIFTPVLAAIKGVPNAHWAKPAVENVVEYGFMQGDSQGNFSGTRALTRYEFAQALDRVLKYFKSESDANRKDMENMVSIMELFQNELKVLETKVNEAGKQIEQQNKTIADMNELTIAIAEQVAANDVGPKVEQLQTQINELNTSMDEVQDKGFLVDTLIKGSVNDIKHLGSATAKAASGARSNLERRKAVYLEKKAEKIAKKELKEAEKLEEIQEEEKEVKQQQQDLEVEMLEELKQ